nr:unnamed protein product [Haemonchus contortus]
MYWQVAHYFTRTCGRAKRRTFTSPDEPLYTYLHGNVLYYEVVVLKGYDGSNLWNFVIGVLKLPDKIELHS